MIDAGAAEREKQRSDALSKSQLDEELRKIKIIEKQRAIDENCREIQVPC